jgi:uncharacterized protein (TIGR02145 family)
MPSTTTTSQYLSFSSSDVANSAATLNGNAYNIRCVVEVQPDVDPVVGGVTWANRNVALKGQFVANAGDPGYFYQYGRNVAWGDGTTAVDGSGTTWSIDANTETFWAIELDPCPTGYHLPAKFDLDNLIDPAKTESQWIAANTTSPRTGILYGATPGMEIVDRTTKDAIFLPRGGAKDQADGSFNMVPAQIWSSTNNDATTAWRLTLSDDPAQSTGVNAPGKFVGRNIRCVKGTYPVPVEVGGVKWAQSNVTLPGQFAATPGDPGYLYQWGINVPWGVTGPVTAMDGSGATWKTAFPSDWSVSPCPSGYRLPVKSELEALINTANVDRVVVAANGTSSLTGIKYGFTGGFEFVDKSNGNVLFIPSAGYRAAGTGAWSNNTIPDGYIWSNTNIDATTANNLAMTNSGITINNNGKGNADSVRCVAE